MAEAKSAPAKEATDLVGATQNKFDRQLRLWGSHGQKALYADRILLLNAGPVGSESLKNLVLPGAPAWVAR